MDLKALLLGLTVSAVVSLAAGGELLQNGGFESLSGWDCWNIHCALSSPGHSGQHGWEVSQR